VPHHAIGKCSSAIAAALLCLGSAHATDLVVEVNDATNEGGRILVALFNQADGFPRRGYWRGENLEPSCGTVSATFRDVPAGTYAITAYHDIDDNKKLNTNSMGIPSEPVAFSNDVVGTMYGPPTFADASFKVSGPSMKISVTLK
jgi:uncharacterized protein (DUF2141 family)